MRELQQLNLYTGAALPDIAHNQELFAFAEYAYATTNTQLQTRSEGGKKPRIVPNTFTEARKLPEAALWEAAEGKEIASLIKHQVCDLVPITSVPAGSKINGSRWVYKIKADETHKARMVVLGWGMVAGVHCGSPFAPVSRLQSICMVLALAAEKNLDVLRYYVPTAFLDSPVDGTIFVKAAPGREERDKNEAHHVMRLRKSLYGIPQAPANWHGTIDDFVIAIGFKSLKSDPCIYIYNPTTKKESTFASWNRDTVILTIYVDDLLLVGQNKVLLKQLDEKPVRRFDITCMGDVSMVLGMRVTRDREKGTLTISQAHYTKSVLKMYGMGECKPVYTIGVGPELSINQGGGNLLTKADTQRYQFIVGSVMYLAQVRFFYVQHILQEGKTTIRYVPTELNASDIGNKILSKHGHRYLIDLINNFKA